jgi:hypothetical protein
MVGVCKSVLQTLLGFFTFGGVQFHPLNAMGKLTLDWWLTFEIAR